MKATAKNSKNKRKNQTPKTISILDKENDENEICQNM